MKDSVYSINIERAVLSAILFNYEIFEDTTLKSDDFYLPAHQNVFSCMKELFDEQMPIDEEFLRQRLSTKKVDDSILIEIMTANPITKISAYEKEIKDGSKRRKLASLATTVKKVAIEDELAVEEAIDTVQKELNEIDNEVEKTRTIADMVHAFEDMMKRAAESNGPIGLKTSISYLNNLVGAFEPKKLTVIGARPSMGKTALACNLANDFLNTSLNPDGAILFDSLEMPGEDIIKRLIACRNFESLSDLKCGVVKDPIKYQNSLRFYATNSNFILHDIKGLSFTQLAAKARKVFRKAQKDGKPIKAWFIDHVGKVKILTTNPFQKRNEIAEGTQLLQNICDEFGVHLFLLTQLNRDITNRKNNRPQLSDIKETGTLEEDADIVIFPHRESYYKRADKNQREDDVNQAELIIPKNRDGQSGTVLTEFNGPFNLFGKKDIPVEVVFEGSSQSSEAIEEIELPDIL